MTTKLYAAIRTMAKGKAKVVDLIRPMVEARDYAELIETAGNIEAAFPVKKGEDGKDENRADRNNLLSILRGNLRHACKGLTYTVTVKKVEGNWQAIESDAKPDEEGEPTEEPTGSEGEDSGDDGEALWQAVDVVLANLGNPAVLSAIQDGLKKLAGKVRN